MDHHDIEYRDKQTTVGHLTLVYGVTTCPESRPIVNRILHVASWNTQNRNLPEG
jgi:hypothetical protein